MKQEDLCAEIISKKGKRIAMLKEMITELEKEIAPLQKHMEETIAHNSRMAKRAAKKEAKNV